MQRNIDRTGAVKTAGTNPARKRPKSGLHSLDDRGSRELVTLEKLSSEQLFERLAPLGIIHGGPIKGPNPSSVIKIWYRGV